MNAHPDAAAFVSASEPNNLSSNIPLSDRVILALDVPTVDDAKRIVEEVGSRLSFFKIGLQLQYAGGFKYAQDLVAQGKKVFLDSKIFDIGNTIEKTVENIALSGVDFLTVHGDRKVIESAASVARGKLKILAVTGLTNLNEADLVDMGINMSMQDFVKLRARIAIQANADGVIASGLEASMIRDLSRELGRPTLKIVTPGVRPAGSARNDQIRIVTPQEAIESGADYLVVGRPVLNAESKLEMLDSIFSQVQSGLTARATIDSQH